MARLNPLIGLALLALLLAAPAAATQEQPAPTGAPTTPSTVFSPNRVVVQWESDASRSDKVDARDDAEVDFKTDLGNRKFQLVTVEPGQSTAEAIGELRSDPAVAVAERDSYSAPNAIPNDPLFGQLWGLRNLGPPGIAGFSGAVAGDDVNAATAWDRAVGLPSVVVADIDSGYRFEHPDLANVAWNNAPEVAGAPGVDDDGNGILDDLHGADFVGNNGEAPTTDGNPTDEDLLSGGHGVHTAGTIGAQGNNGVGITGVARNIRIMPLRVCSRFPSLGDSRCPVSSQIAAINYAAVKGAKVANMSLGGTSSSQAQVNAIAAAKDVLFVISAGNDSVDNDSVHHYPCDYKPQEQASPPVPGAIDNIVCVAATDQADGLASFSDWGETSVDLGAPGTETLSTYPFTTPFEDSFTIDDFASKWPATGANGGFQRTSESPLTSFGMTDVIGDPAAETVRETTSAAVAVPPNGGCKLNQTRRVVLSGGEHYRYSILLNGVEQASSEPDSTAEPGLERRFLNLPASFKGGGPVQVRFRFTTGMAPAADTGVWLDDVSIVCSQAVGQASAYAFLQGTSMAAPHVTGAAGLLFSLKPTASVTEVRSALLASVDPVGSLSGKTTTGGRLDVAAALDQLVPVGAETVPPETAITSGPPSSTTSDAASFSFSRTDADAGTFECKLDGAASWSPCSSPASYTVGVGGHTFEVRAKSPVLVDPTPATASWTVKAPSEEGGGGGGGESEGGGTVIVTGPLNNDQPPAPGVPPTPPSTSCKVPKLAGLSLSRAKSALTAAHCTLGKLTKPKARKGQKAPVLVVKSSSPAANATSASGKVDLALGPKPKPKKTHRH